MQNSNDITADTEIRDIFLLSAASIQQARNGPYWKLALTTATRSLDGKIWSPLSQEFTNLSPGMFVEVVGRSSLYRDQVQIVIDQMTILDEEQCAKLDMTDFLPSSPRDPKEMWEELCQLCKQEFSHGAWHKFVFSVLNDDEIHKNFLKAPAAKGVHHAYTGGLLEHTLGVVKLVRDIASHYVELDKQTLLAGAIFHDFGKIWELSGGLVNDYTTTGRLIGHVDLGLEHLQKYLDNSGLEQELIEHFKHLILSHHGSYTFGASRLPQTAEAMLLHFADNIDAKMAQCRHIFEGAECDTWSSYQPTLERYMYKPKRTPEAKAKLAPTKNKGEEQCLSLLKV